MGNLKEQYQETLATTRQFVTDTSNYVINTAEYCLEHTGMLAFALEKIVATPRIRIDTEHTKSLENIARANNHLQTGPLIAVFVPHANIFDPLMFERFVRSYLKALRTFLITSEKFKTKEEIRADFPGVSMPDMGIASRAFGPYSRKIGFEPIYVVQKRLLLDTNLFPDRKARLPALLFNRNSIDIAKERMKQPGTVGLLSLEGTRGLTGGFLRADPDSLGWSEAENALILPTILSGVTKMQSREKQGLHGLHPSVDIVIRVGEPVSLEELRREAAMYEWVDSTMGVVTPADALMVRTRDMGIEPWEPDKNPHGVYTKENIRLKSEGIQTITQ